MGSGSAFSYLMVPVAMVLISIAMSTREQREEARVKLKPYLRRVGIAAALLWGFIIACVMWPR